MNFDRYSVFARLLPAMLSAAPFYVLSLYYITPKAADFIELLRTFTWVGDLTITTAAIYFLMQVNRWISKSLFEDRIFNNGNKQPTTEYLLHLHTYYSQEYTQQIHDKISHELNIKLYAPSEELDNENEARKKIAEAVSLIRTKVASGRLVGQHNIEYGFARNLAGGSVVGVLISLINLAIFSFLGSIAKAAIISLVLGIVYALYLLFADRLLKSLGENYARVLIQEYMSINT